MPRQYKKISQSGSLTLISPGNMATFGSSTIKPLRSRLTLNHFPYLLLSVGQVLYRWQHIPPLLQSGCRCHRILRNKKSGILNDRNHSTSTPATQSCSNCQHPLGDHRYRRQIHPPPLKTQVNHETKSLQYSI